MLIRDLEVQRTIESVYIPSDEDFQLWIESALKEYTKDAEVLIRIVDEQEISVLNQQYRFKQGTTNILSFPSEVPDIVTDVILLGDLVVCASILEDEAKRQGKALKNHWAHIIIHGILHLLGYDHIQATEALEMEKKEVFILQQLNVGNPYWEK